MSEGPSSPTIRVFTHPACGSCGAAVADAWKVGEGRPGLDLRTISLATPEGLAEAHREGIRTIPTVILSDGAVELQRWVGTPGKGELEAAVVAFAAGTPEVVAS